MTKTLRFNGDIPNLGALCARIRGSRDVSPKELALSLPVAESTITRFESGEIYPREITFTAYINSNLLNLRQNQIELLKSLYDRRDLIEKKEESLSTMTLEYIKSANSSSKLGKLVEKLQKSGLPGFIMDDLWFGHAINGALWGLFNISDKANHLQSWEGWHPIGVRFRKDTPSTAAILNKGQYLPHLVAYFFEDICKNNIIFTNQMRMLNKRLQVLRESENFYFSNAWNIEGSFNRPFAEIMLERTINFRGRIVHLKANLDDTATVEIEKGYPVNYRLFIWEPVGDSENALKELRFESNKIYFATDYAKKYPGVRHINDWPEV